MNNKVGEVFEIGKAAGRKFYEVEATEREKTFVRGSMVPMTNIDEAVSTWRKRLAKEYIRENSGNASWAEAWRVTYDEENVKEFRNGFTKGALEAAGFDITR